MITSSFGTNGWTHLNNQQITSQGLFPNVSTLKEATMNRLTNAINVDGSGNVIINRVSITKLVLGDGKNIEINDLNLSLVAGNRGVLRKVNDAGFEIRRKSQELVLTDSSTVDVDVVSTLIAEYTDGRNFYALVEDSYVTDDGTTLKTRQFIAVTGFKFAATHHLIFIPAYVSIDDNEFPVTKIISTRVEGEVTRQYIRNSRMHETEETFVHPPVGIIANHIIDIDLTYDLDSAENGAFYKFPVYFISMRNLRFIEGLPGHCLPVFSGMSNLEKLELPMLKSIRNVIFASNNANLIEVSYPKLETIEETIFNADCPSLSGMSLPSLQLLKGCDYFCCRDITLKNLVLPMTFGIRPHDYHKCPDFDDHRHHHFMLKIHEKYRKFKNTTAMEYFLHGCISLCNALMISETKETTSYNAPHDLKNVDVSLYGIHFIGRSGNIGSWKNDDKNMYGSCGCTFEQLCNEQGLAVPTDLDTTDIIPIAGSEFNYCVENTYGTMLDGTDKKTVLAIDFRTALLNDTVKPKNSKSPIHLYTETSANRIAFDADAYEIIDEATELHDFFTQMLGDNQYYNFGFTETEEPEEP